MEDSKDNVQLYRDAVQLLVKYELNNDDYTNKVIDKFEEMEKSISIKILLSSYEVLLNYSKQQELLINHLKLIFK